MTTATAPRPPSPAPTGNAQSNKEWTIPDSDMNLEQFITLHNEAIIRVMRESYRPHYLRSRDTRPLPLLLRRPMGRQGEILRGASMSLIWNRGTTIVGEMGVGKTYIAIGACQMAGLKRILVICPTHLTRKWKREVEQTLGNRQAEAVIASRISDLANIVRRYGTAQNGSPKTLFVIMSKEMAKGTHKWKPDYHPKLPITGGKLIQGEDGAPFLKPDAPGDIYREDGSLDPSKAWEQLERIPACRSCDRILIEKEELDAVAGRKRGKCLGCDAPLWTAVARNLEPACRRCRHTALESPSTNAIPQCERCGAAVFTAIRPIPAEDPPVNPGPRRIALSDYIKKKMPHYFDLLVTDEVHQYKEQDSAQGINVGNLAQCIGRSLALTGTFMGGYSSNIFHLLYRFSPDFRTRFPYDGVSHWKKEYGLSDEITIWKEADGDFKYHGKTTKRRIGRPRRKEKPGISPAALFHVIGNTLFLRLQDVSSSLPPFEEIVSHIPMEQEKDEETGFSQYSAYSLLHAKLKEAVTASLAQGSHSLLGVYVNTLLAYADGCYKGETAVHPHTGRLLAKIPPLDYERVYPKEQELIRIVRQEKEAGRKCLVYVTHTETRDITPRLKELLEAQGLRTAVMKSGTPSAEKREEWIKNRLEEGIDALICNPGLVETGMDLIDFPTIVWTQPEYNVYTMRQASRRSWRIGQKQPVKVYYLIYRQNIQSKALRLIARKTQVSLSVEGDLPSGGIVSLAGQDDNLVTALARNIAGQSQDDDDTGPDDEIEAGRQAEQEAEILLVDPDDWETQPGVNEPSAAPAPTPRPQPQTPQQPPIAGIPADPRPAPPNRRSRTPDPRQMSLFQFLDV